MIADTLLVDFLPSSADSIRVIKLSVEGFMSTIRDTLALYKIIGRKFDVIDRFWGTLALELRTLNYQSKSWRHREISIKTSEQTLSARIADIKLSVEKLTSSRDFYQNIRTNSMTAFDARSSIMPVLGIPPVQITFSPVSCTPISVCVTPKYPL